MFCFTVLLFLLNSKKKLIGKVPDTSGTYCASLFFTSERSTFHLYIYFINNNSFIITLILIITTLLFSFCYIITTFSLLQLLFALILLHLIFVTSLFLFHLLLSLITYTRLTFTFIPKYSSFWVCYQQLLYYIYSFYSR